LLIRPKNATSLLVAIEIIFIWYISYYKFKTFHKRGPNIIFLDEN